MKKIISFGCASLLVLSMMSFSLPNNNSVKSDVIVNEASDECEDRANNVMHQALASDPDMPIDEVTWYMNAAYALCKGYTMEQIINTYID